MAPTATRRVSYVIPPPTTAVPALKLPPLGAPRNGRIGPILLERQYNGGPTIVEERQARPSHPRHRLGVAALALDTATQLAGSDTPEGILYTGGRDGMIISWELGVRMKKRSRKYGSLPNESDRRGYREWGRWELLTGWADEDIDEEDDDEGLKSDGDVIGDVVNQNGARSRKRGLSNAEELPYEEKWETDLDAFEAGRPSYFRQFTQAHTDWVNDLLLCNMNQTVISASSDGTIKAWSPHSTQQAYPTTIGTHSDYVRCLALGRERNWVASGSFDRTIKLWSLTSPRSDPIMTMQPPDASNPKSSVYALATDPFGHMIASGSPERVVRTWDPRSGKRIGKLVGHTDNIRAVCISEGGRYLLTGSADASIKLWSTAAPQRCIHTFTHHTDSVWSLFSQHPSLEIFYSGDRSGLVCKVDVEGCGDVADGECVVVCRDMGSAGGDQGGGVAEGVNKIAVMDDNLLWTASGSSSVKRWRAPGRRVMRDGSGWGSGEVESPTAEAPTSSPSSPRRSSVGMELSSPRTSPPRGHQMLEPAAPIASRSTPRSQTQTAPSIAASSISNFSLHPRDADPDSTLFGIPYSSLVRLSSPNDVFPLSSSSFIGNVGSVGRGGGGGGGRGDPEVSTLYSAASIMSVPRHLPTRSPLASTFSYPNTGSDTLATGDLQPLNTSRAEYEERDVAADAKPLYPVPDDVITGDKGLVRGLMMNDRMHALTVDTAGEVAVWDIVRSQCLGVFAREDVANASHAGSTSGASEGAGDQQQERSPRQALETVRERIEGEAVVVPWSQADTGIGELTIHLLDRPFEAEIFADEAGYGSEKVYNDEFRLGIGKWVLRNLFLGFIREEQQDMWRTQEDGHSHRLNLASSPLSPHHRASVETSPRTPGITSSSTLPPLTPAIIPKHHRT